MKDKWIPVYEKMPENGKCILIFSKSGGVAEGCKTLKFTIVL